MKKQIVLAVSSLALAMTSSIFADSFSWHLQLGDAITGISNTENVYVLPSIANQYETTSSSSSEPIAGVGVSYEYDYEETAFNLGLTGYYLSSSVSGVKTAGINAGGTDTFNYSANGSSYALMVEPKWIYTVYSWQPYFLTGMGVAWNHFQGYSETPNGAGNTPALPFSGATNTNFAYEFGAGIQHPLTQNDSSPVIALEYRYMYWGKAGLETSALQSTDNTMSFGDLHSNTVLASVSWPF